MTMDQSTTDDPKVESSHLRSGLVEISAWANQCARVCRDPIEREAWEAIHEIANRTLRKAPVYVAPEPKRGWWRKLLSS